MCPAVHWQTQNTCFSRPWTTHLFVVGSRNVSLQVRVPQPLELLLLPPCGAQSHLHLLDLHLRGLLLGPLALRFVDILARAERRGGGQWDSERGRVENRSRPHSRNGQGARHSCASASLPPTLLLGHPLVDSPAIHQWVWRRTWRRRCTPAGSTSSLVTPDSLCSLFAQKTAVKESGGGVGGEQGQRTADALSGERWLGKGAFLRLPCSVF